MLTDAPFTELVDALEAAGVAASMDPAALNLPGAWLAMDGLRTEALSGALRVECRLVLICGDRDPLRAVETLGELYDLVVPGVLTPDGPVVTQGVVMPGDPTPLPGLVVPVWLYT